MAGRRHSRPCCSRSSIMPGVPRHREGRGGHRQQQLLVDASALGDVLKQLWAKCRELRGFEGAGLGWSPRRPTTARSASATSASHSSGAEGGIGAGRGGLCWDQGGVRRLAHTPRPATHRSPRNQSQIRASRITTCGACNKDSNLLRARPRNVVSRMLVGTADTCLLYTGPDGDGPLLLAL